MNGFDERPAPGAHRHPGAEPVWAQESFTSYAEWDEPATAAGAAGAAGAAASAGSAGEEWDEPDGGDSDYADGGGSDYADGGGEQAANPVADEVVRLIGGVQDWARRTFAEASTATHTGPECQWCPLCQFLAVLKGDRPDVTERVAEAGTALASALRAVLESAASGGPSAQPGRHAHPGQDPEGGPSPRVQKIDLGDQP